jgi:GH25 family lysozyme M1 (1,4-beta-N-acetylmuramidase)
VRLFRPAVVVSTLAALAVCAAGPGQPALASPVTGQPAGVPGPGQPALAGPLARQPAGVPGIDISSWQPHVNWKTVTADHLKFAYIKATEGRYYTSPDFARQWKGARAAGVVTGAYHFAVPNSSGGAAQARYFAAHGGGWKANALPGVLDIETNPYGRRVCYGLSHEAMTSWIRAFVRTYHARTGWWPVINTFTGWWNRCTGHSTVFAAKDALWINGHRRTAAPLPAGWTSYAVWQWAESGTYPADQDVIPAKLFKKLHHEPH